MRFIADLHIHSRYSRATSPDMCPEGLWQWAQVKGISVIGTGDFTHPAWAAELGEKLEPLGNGLFSLRKDFRTGDVPASCRSEVSFLLTAEISCIYRKNDRTRKVHAIVFAPDFASAGRISASLAKIGNLSADGRPILGLDAKTLLRIVLDASPEAMLVPAHAWTPHFSVFGAASGFDSLEECFEELTPHICAIETGLSSDPAMNWRLSQLDRITLLSNSDAHSPAKIGREANVFDTDLSYPAIVDAIRTRNGFNGTIEFFPEEGKYHYDGHRDCGICLTPQETINHAYRCPVCGRRITVGVMHRVEKLADRAEGGRPANAPGYRSIIPLQEIIAEAMSAGVAAKKVVTAYRRLLEDIGSEFTILLDVPLEEIGAQGSARLQEAIGKMREGSVNITPGYDGEFGKIRIFEQAHPRPARGQTQLF
ncbi:MAG: endonuclease Q family protein [Thermodesulfovibrionales bacterium]